MKSFLVIILKTYQYFLAIVIFFICGFFTALFFENRRSTNSELTLKKEVYVENSALIESVNKVYASSVIIKSIEGKVLGSGFVFDYNGAVITAAHVVSDAKPQYIVKFVDGTELFASMSKKDFEHDLAILKIDDDYDFQAVKIDEANNLQIGQKLFAIGYNTNMEFSVSDGIIGGLDRQIDASSEDFTLSLKNLIQLDLNASLGMSGAPVFNLNGELVGMISAVSKNTNGAVFALKSIDILNTAK